MTPETTQRKQAIPEWSERPVLPVEECFLDVWARSAPIRLAGYDDDLLETHILRSID